MLMKLLLIIFVITIVYFLFFKKKPISKSKHNNQNTSDLVECSCCGVYVDIKESIISNNKYYCSSECVDNQSC